MLTQARKTRTRRVDSAAAALRDASRSSSPSESQPKASACLRRQPAHSAVYQGSGARAPSHSHVQTRRPIELVRVTMQTCAISLFSSSISSPQFSGSSVRRSAFCPSRAHASLDHTPIENAGVQRRQFQILPLAETSSRAIPNTSGCIDSYSPYTGKRCG